MISSVLAEVLVLSLAMGHSTAQTSIINCNHTDDLCGSNSHCNVQSKCECDTNYFSPTGVNANCTNENEPDERCNQYDMKCVYCGPTFQGPCEKCTNFLQGTTCINVCMDFIITVLSNRITSRICNDQTMVGQGGLPEWAIIVFAIIGALILIVAVSLLIGCSILILNRSSHGRFDVEDIHQDNIKNQPESPEGTLRTKRSNSFSYQQEDKETSEALQHNPTYDETDAEEETRFMQKLEYLRKHAEVFLKMLNDMRRRLKELQPEAPAAQQYRNVMKDVTRLLYLLNKKPSTVEMPADGITLLDWSENILNRYLKSQGMVPKITNRLSILGPQDETNF